MLEPSFGFDFSRVRVHADAQSDTIAGAFDARAVTIGRDIHFANDEYDLHTAAGQHLIAHELTHVVQQHSADRGSRAEHRATGAQTAAETEADAAASSVAAGESVAVQVAAPVAPALAPNDGSSGVPPAWKQMMSLYTGSPHAEGKEGGGEGKGAEELKLGIPAPIETGGLFYEGLMHEKMPGLKQLEPLKKMLGPLDMFSGLGEAGEAIFGDGPTGERIEKGALGGAKAVSGAGATGTMLGLLPEVPGWASMGTIGELGGGAAFSAGASVLGSGVAGYETGKMLLGGANDYAKAHDIFGEGRDSTEAAADAGVSVRDYFQDSWAGKAGDVFGDVAGGITSVGSSFGTAAYSGLHAAGHGLSRAWDWVTGSDPELDKEVQQSANAASAEMGAEMSRRDLQEESDLLQTSSSSVAHEDAPPPPPLAAARSRRH